MKTIEKTIEVCECWCEYCEFNLEQCFEVDCPYCECCTFPFNEVDDWEKQKVECEHCNKKFRCKMIFNYM